MIRCIIDSLVGVQEAIYDRNTPLTGKIIITSSFSALLALCEGNPSVTGGFSSQRPVTRNIDVETPVVWDAVLFIMTSLDWLSYGHLPIQFCWGSIVQ